MKIAIPVKTNKENPPVAPLFGKAKWFAFIENRKVEIKASPVHGGRAVIQWFVGEAVDTIIMQEMGMTPYEMIKAQGGIRLYHSGFERVLLNELIKKFADGELEMLYDAKMQEIITHHEGRHNHGSHHGHEHHHHR